MTKRGPFEVRKSEEVYKNRWITVRQDDVIRPDGSEGVFGVVVYSPGVSIVAIDDEGNVILNREYKYGVNDYIYETPAGGVETGQTNLEAAKSELLEEAGVTAKHWRSLGTIFPLSTILENGEMELFLATGIAHVEPTHNTGQEMIEKVIMPYKKTLEMIKNNEINYAPACIALLKARDFVNPKFL